MSFWGLVDSWADLQDKVRAGLLRSCTQHVAALGLASEDILAEGSLESIRDELSAVVHELSEVRLTKGGRKPYHVMLASYFADMARVFQSLRRMTKAGSRMCFVVGDSAPYGVYAPVDDWLGRLAVAAGFKAYRFDKIRDRNVKWKNRKHRVPLKEGHLWISG